MPPEWAPHRATYLVWPHNRDTWPGKFEAIPPVFARMAAAIAEFEPLRLLVADEEMAAAARAAILAAAGAAARLDRIGFTMVATNDSWIRDHGPIFVNRAAPGDAPAQVALDFGFNSWGEKYGAFDLDDAVPRRLGERCGFEVVEPPMVLEGGSIDVDGAGTLLTTESCLLNPNRNPALDRAEIERRLKYWLGVSSVLWLGEGNRRRRYRRSRRRPGTVRRSGDGGDGNRRGSARRKLSRARRQSEAAERDARRRGTRAQG